MNFFAHETAIVNSSEIGEGSKIWDFCNVLEGAKIGKNCNICHGSFIEGKVSIGNNVTVKNGVYLWDGVEVEDEVFIGPAAVFTNDANPRSGNNNFELQKTLLKKGCSIGANATILPGLTIGKYSMVGAGAVVTKDVPDYAIVYGNPAEIVGKVDKEGRVVEKSS